MEKTIKIRINNIECRPTIYKENEYEMVEWYKNERYGVEQKLIDEGYEKVVYPDGDWGMKKGSHIINSSCFKHPESCYVIAWLEPNKREPDVNMKTVGSRMLELKQDELNTFMKVYRLANDMIIEQMNEDEKD